MLIKTIKKGDFKTLQEVLVVYGETGIGKTSSCLEFFEKKNQECIVLNLENRLHHLLRWYPQIQTIDINDYMGFVELMKHPEIIKGKGLIIDSISHFYDLLISHYSHEDKDVDLTFNSWGQISRRLNDFILFCKNNGGKDILLTAREKTIKDNNKIVGYRADVKDDVCYKYVNTIIRMSYHEKTNKIEREVQKDIILPYGYKIESVGLLNQARAKFVASSEKPSKQTEIPVEKQENLEQI